MSNLIPTPSPNFAPLNSTSFAAFYTLYTLWLLFLVSVPRGGSVWSEVISPKSIGGKIRMNRDMNGIFDRQVGGRSDTHLMLI
jgi:hypothetical protein